MVEGRLMARTRLLKPEFFRSRSLARVSHAARLTFQGLWCDADAAGRGLAHPVLLKGAIWPLDPSIGEAELEAHLQELSSEHIVLYYDGEDRLYQICNWEKHQSAGYRTGEAKFPAPESVQVAAPVVQLARPAVQVARGVVHKDMTKEKESKEEKIAPKRSDIWDALTEHFGPASTKTEQSNRGRHVKELMALDATPTDVHERIQEHKRRGLNWTLTANALLSHWTELTPKASDAEVDPWTGAVLSRFMQA